MATDSRVDFFSQTSLYLGLQSFYDVANTGVRIPIAGRYIANTRGIPLSKATGLGRRLGETLPWGRLSNFLDPASESFLRTTSRSGGLRGLAKVFMNPKAAVASLGPGNPWVPQIGRQLVFRDVVSSAAMRKGAASLMAQTAARIGYPIMMASWIVPMVFDATVGATNMLKSIGERAPGLEMGGNFIDSRATYTMRQRAISAISQSNLSARAAIGGEAFFLHRS